MSDKGSWSPAPDQRTEGKANARRAFLRKVGRTAAKGAIAAPAVAMLLSVSYKPARSGEIGS